MERTEQLEARTNMSSRLIPLPNRAIPRTENELPMRDRERTLRFEARLKKSSKLILLPSFTHPKTLRDEPRRAQERTDKELPMWNVSNSDKHDPNFV
jgi:hypothetical protein